MQENSGFHYECGVNKFILGLIGVWPESNQKFIKKHRTLVDAIVLFITLWVPRAAAFILLWGEIDALAQAGATNVPIALSVVKLLILYRRKNDFAKILDGMKEDWRKPMTKEEYEVVMKMARLGRRISILSTFLTINAIWLGAVVQIFYNIETTIVENPDPRLTLNLFWVVYLPYDTSKTSNFVLTWVIHFYTSIMSAVVYGSFDGFIVVLVFHLCGQLDLLKIWARKIADKTDLKSFKRKLRFLVKRHEQLNEDSLLRRRNVFIGLILLLKWHYVSLSPRTLTEVLHLLHFKSFSIMKCYYELLTIAIFLNVFVIGCNANVAYAKNRRQTSNSVLVEVAKELVERSKNTNQVLNLNLSNLILLLMLKTMVIGTKYLENSDYKNRELEEENIVSEEEIALALGYLIGDTCLYRAACEVPRTARNYLHAIDMITQTLSLMPPTLRPDKDYEKTISDFRKAIEYGELKQCPPEYSCKKENIKNFLRPEYN
ncbi:uncharacterized protein LOC141536503 isoform X2 [Cotesia typhae]|uniref:uncharacterized protein LOC141536503 isoform X2 n=1 Tax=Cotesia typhae TaxID=2053667 RepID=UPI003D695AFF